MTYEEMDQAIDDFILVVKARYTLHGAYDFRDWLIEDDKIGNLLERVNYAPEEIRNNMVYNEFNRLFGFWRDGQLFS